MPAVFDGGPDTSPVTSAELTAYDAAKAASAGDRTAQEQALIDAVDAKLNLISADWDDSGGPGGFQAAVAAEVLLRAAALQGGLANTVRQWARPGRERALLEMFGVLTRAVAERDQLLLEFRERLNASPY